MSKSVFSKLLIFVFLCIISVTQAWAGVESWSYTNQYQRRAWPRAAQSASDISYNNNAWSTLGDWGGNYITNYQGGGVSGDMGDAHAGTAIGNSAEISILIFKHTKNIPAYSKYVRTAGFNMYFASNFFYHGFGLYLFDDESTAKSTGLDVSRDRGQTWAKSYEICEGHSEDLSGNHGSISGSKTITYDNSTGSAAKDISKYIDLTHTTTDGDHVEKNEVEWVTWKETSSTNETWYYYKHFTFNANEGTGTAMAVQTIENSGNLTANTYTRTGYRFTGWNTSADGKGTAYTDGQAITATASDKGTITLYAQWETVEVPVSAAGYATVFSDKNLVVPAGVEVYGFTYSNGELVQGTQISEGAVLPANKGYLVKATVGTYNFAPTSSAATAYESVLTGTTSEISTPSGDVYVWSKPEGYSYGFYKYTGATIPAGRAYYIKQ